MPTLTSRPSIKRGQLSAEVITAAAITLADRDGIDALSMRKLAAQLGATAMSLYNHVASKDALLDLMLDAVVAQIDSPDPGGPWRPMMERRARAMRQVLLRHPWAPPLLMSRIALGPAILRDGEACLACLIGAGFTYAQADWARNAIDNHIYGFTTQEMNFPVEPEAYRSAAAEYLPMIPAEHYPHSHAATRAIIDGHYDGRLDFDFGLGLILDGLAAWVRG